MPIVSSMLYGSPKAASQPSRLRSADGAFWSPSGKSVSPAESPEGRRNVAHLFGSTTRTRADPLGAMGPSAWAHRAWATVYRRRWGVCT
jgi:hypothetical protein